jgi:hypothetical protein
MILNLIPNFFNFKCPYTYTLNIFSIYFVHAQGKWSKLVIRITKDENSYHLCLINYDLKNNNLKVFLHN